MFIQINMQQRVKEISKYFDVIWARVGVRHVRRVCQSDGKIIRLHVRKL